MPEQWSRGWKTACVALALVAGSVQVAYAGVPDVTQSFYVPQRGSLASTQEGTAAALSFRMCPNNDAFSFGGTAAATGHGRIRVVVKDVNGAGVPGIAAADICVLFNGGTTAQGFFGTGADSIVAYNGNSICPNVRCIPADAPTDANGFTYITFRGNDGITPGVSTRDPNRKWGHWDSDVPVYVLGFKLAGRLATAQPGASPAYVLRIKNLDVAAGLTSSAGIEQVIGGDYTTALAALPVTANPFRYWYDVDASGTFTGGDVTTILTHLGHDCDSPSNP